MNNSFWGEGFTDWVTTRNATSLYPKHKQPFLPSDLGFYDLSDPKILIRQSEIARKYGVNGFGFYHYFFDEDTPALNIPINNLRNNPGIDVEYFICWVNADWTKSWCGDEKTIIYEQKYTNSTIDKLAENACWHFQDSRYAKFDGKPIFYIHEPNQLNINEFKQRFLKISSAHGFPNVLFASPYNYVSQENEKEFDFLLGYPPGDARLNGIYAKLKIQNIIRTIPIFKLIIDQLNLFQKISVISYPEYAVKYAKYLDSKIHLKKYIPTILSGWDNTPRYGTRGFVFEDFNSQDFGRLLSHAYSRSIENNKGFIMIKAWNEWAEGNVLEPSQRFQYSILETLRHAKETFHV